MVSTLQNVRNESVLLEPRQSLTERLAEVTELHPHDFSHFCFFGILDNGELTSWRNPRSYLTPCWFITGFLWYLCPLWFSLSLLRVFGPMWTTCVLPITDLTSSFPIVLPPPYLPQLTVSSQAGGELCEALCLSTLGGWQTDSPSTAQTWLWHWKQLLAEAKKTTRLGI